jgi:hypothetical protein
MVNHLKSEAESIQRSSEVVGVIDENRRVIKLLFIAEFTQKQHGELYRSGLKQPNMEELVRLGIDGGVQPVPFVVDLNYRLIYCDVIRLSIAVGL